MTAFPGKTFDHLLHLWADEDTFNTASYLRKNLTKPEKLLWNELKNRNNPKLENVFILLNSTRFLKTLRKIFRMDSINSINFKGEN